MMLSNKEQTITLNFTRSIDLESTVAAHGWVQLAPWNWDGHRLFRPERFGSTTGELSLHQIEPSRLVAEWTGATVPELEIVRCVRRWLSLDWESQAFCEIARSLHPVLAAFVESGGGRFLRGSCFYEDFVKTICTINTTWEQTIRMVSALIVIGEGTFPSPAQILACGAEPLREKCRLGFRVGTVLRATERMLADGTLSENGQADEAALTYKYLLGLWGIGPYAAAHCRMMLHDFSQLPVDSEVSAYLVSRGVGAECFATHFVSWGSYAFLGYKLPRVIEKTSWVEDQQFLLGGS